MNNFNSYSETSVYNILNKKVLQPFLWFRPCALAPHIMMEQEYRLLFFYIFCFANTDAHVHGHMCPGAVSEREVGMEV